MKSNAPRANKIEQDRIDKMMQLGCAACAFLGVPNLANTECHHMLDGNVRLGHWFSIPLCAGHHRGAWTEGQLTWIEPHQRVAISDGRKAFTRIYPTEWQLWERVQFVLHLDDAKPQSKILGRRHVDDLRSDRQPACPTGVLAGAQRGAVLSGNARVGEPQLRLVGPVEVATEISVGVPAARRGSAS